MTARVFLASAAVVVSSALAATAASAQTPVRSFTELKSKVKAGQNIRIFNSSGKNATPLEGRVVSITDSQLEIRQGGTWGEKERRLVYSPDTVVRVENADSHWNGIVIGGAIGVLMAIWEINTPQSDEGSGGASAAVFPVAGGYIGNWIDGKFNRLIYTSSPTPRIAFVPLTPLFGNRRVGIAGSIRF